jgi:hypothetical protein
MAHELSHVVQQNSASVVPGQSSPRSQWRACPGSEVEGNQQPVRRSGPTSSPVRVRHSQGQSGCGGSLTAASPTFDWTEKPEHTRVSADMPDDTDFDEGEIIDEVVATFAPACFDGGGASRCNPDTGNYDIVSNGNTCCSRECTQGHEQVHVNDLGDCCRSLAAAIAAGGDRAALIRRYNAWMSSGALAWSECNAHSFSVSCLENLSSQNSCDSKSSQCCQDISEDLAAHRRSMTSWCARAPASRPACPF